MRYKTLSLLLAGLILLSGCAGNSVSSSESDSTSSALESQSESTPAYQPVYTYLNSDPEMVMATFKNADETIEITYDLYRLILDTEELFNRNTAIRELTAIETLKSDLAALEIEIDEEAFSEMVTAQITAMMEMGYSDMLAQIIKYSDLTAEDIAAITKDILRLQYLGELMYRHYEDEASKTYPKPEIPEGMSEEDEGYAEAFVALQEWEFIVVGEAEAMLNEYQLSLIDRVADSDNDEFLAIIDGEAVAWDQEKQSYVNFYQISSRISNILAIHEGEVMLTELEKAGVEYDEALFEAEYSKYMAACQQAPEYMAEIDKCLKKLGATQDDYFQAFRSVYLFSFVEYDFSQMLMEQFNAMSAEDSNMPESIEHYFEEWYQEMLENREILNVSGK